MKRKEQAILRSKQKYEHLPLFDLSFPDVAEQERQENREFVEQLRHCDKSQVLKELQKKNPVFDLSWMKEEEQNIFQELSERFVSDARSFDETLCEDDIFQALRNMWIIWMLELLFDQKLEYHNAMFGYSMLYPYSDNFLDDTAISNEEKQAFNAWFTKRLHGEPVPCESDLKRTIDALVSMIEHQYSRCQYPSVYDGLYMIQNAQIRSVSQNRIQDRDIIYDISVEKGGTSVIADGYLINGKMNDEEYQFCVDFGFALQIVDDIQDQKEDQDNKHHTLATLCETRKERYALFQKCWIFFEKILQEANCRREEIKEFVRNSCHELLAQCVLESEDLYPAYFCSQLKKAMPLDEAYMQHVMEDTKQRMKHPSA